METRQLYDWRGNLLTVPADATTCHDGTGPWRTHALFLSRSGGTHQALTKCGRRAGPIPGGSTVDCPECLEILNH